MEFRTRLLGTLRAIEPVLMVPGVLVAGSEVPNLLEPDARGETYVFEDETLPLLVFGHLSLLRPREPLRIEGLSIPVPRPAGWIVEKLLSDRSGEKGDRDLPVALALLLVCDAADRTEFEATYRGLPPEQRHAVRSGLSTLSLLEPRLHMPDPTGHRQSISLLMALLENGGPDR